MVCERSLVKLQSENKGWESRTPMCVAPLPGKGEKEAGRCIGQGVSNFTINA